MKLYELKSLMDMLNPNCEVVVQPPNGGPRPIGFAVPEEPQTKEVPNTNYEGEIK